MSKFLTKPAKKSCPKQNENSAEKENIPLKTLIKENLEKYLISKAKYKKTKSQKKQRGSKFHCYDAHPVLLRDESTEQIQREVNISQLTHEGNLVPMV
jgi:hypothetical protein